MVQKDKYIYAFFKIPVLSLIFTEDVQRNGLSQLPLRYLFFSTSSHHHCSDVTFRKVSIVRVSCFPPPHNCKSRYRRSSTKSFLHTPKHSQQMYSTCIITGSTQHSCLSYKIKSSSDLHPGILDSTPETSSTLYPSLNCPNKTYSIIRGMNWWKTSISIIFNSGLVLLSYLVLDTSNVPTDKLKIHVVPELCSASHTKQLSNNIYFLSPPCQIFMENIPPIKTD